MIFISLCLYSSGSKPPAPFSTLSSSTSWPTSWTGPLVTFLNNHYNLVTNTLIITTALCAVTNNLQVQDVYSIRGLQPATSYDLKVKKKQKNSGIMVIMIIVTSS